MNPAATTRPCRTRTFRALEFEFAVDAPDEHLARYLDEVFSGCATDEPVARHRYAIVEQAGSWTERYELRFDGELVDALSAASGALALLLWHINRQVVAASADRYLLVHASAAVLDGRGLLFPAAMESGKSTLVAGLVGAGFDYVTDEAAAIDPASGVVVPYAKPLSIDSGSWPVLSGLAPDLVSELRPWVVRQWHVPPDRVRPDAVAAPAPVRFVVCPRYDPSGPTAVEPLARAQALAALIENSFNFRRHGAAGLRALHAVVAASRCYRIRVSSLPDACTIIRELVVDGEHPEEAGR